MPLTIPTWALWLLLSNMTIAFIEYTYRSGNYDTFLQALPYIIVPILCGQWGLFNGFSLAPSLFIASATFSLMNCLFRIPIVYYLGETMNYVNWIGVVLLVVSVILLKIK